MALHDDYAVETLWSNLIGRNRMSIYPIAFNRYLIVVIDTIFLEICSDEFMDLFIVVLTIVQVASTSKFRTEIMDRVIVNQSLTLPCPIKMIPNSGLLQWLFKAHNTSVYRLMCMKKPDESECLKKASQEPWLADMHMSVESVDISKVTPHHSGTYQCMYMDSANLEKYMIEVNVLHPPGKPVIHISPTVIAEDNVVNLTCHTDGGNPEPSIKWVWKDFSNKPIPKRNISNSTLIRPVNMYGRTVLTVLWMPKSFDDGNSISCLAENKLAEVSSNWMYLNVNYPPIIYDFPASPYFVLLGTEVNIECKATRKTAASFKWLSTNDRIVSETPQLIIRSITSQHKGPYRCTVTNPYGTSSATVNISVLTSPAIGIMTNVTIAEGEVLMTSCNVIPATSNISWWINSKCVGATNVLEMRLPTVLPVQLQCRATVRLSQIPGQIVMATSSQSITVTTRYKPRTPTISVHPSGDHVIGTDATITCIPDDKEPGYPKPDYVWRKSNSQWERNNTNFLTFSSLIYDDAGTYICTLFNEMGSSDDVQMVLVVYGHPASLDSSSSIVNVKEGQPFSIACQAQAFPVPEISWSQNDVPLTYSSNNSRFSVERKQMSMNGYRSLLHIDGVTSGTKETYRCYVTNKYGTLHQEFRIQVHYPPKLISDLLTVAADSRGQCPGRGPVALNCTSIGSPAISVSWLRKLPNQNERLIENSTDGHLILDSVRDSVLESVLYVKNFQNEDYGRYFCLAKNTEGQIETEFEIKKLSMPDPSHDLILTKQSWNSLSFKWIPGFDGGFKQIFLVSYVTDMQTNPTQLRTDRPQVTIADLLPDTSYTLTVSSSNRLGTTLATLSAKVKTEALTVGDDKILTVSKEDHVLELKLPSNLSASTFCLTIEEASGTSEGPGSWTVMKRCVRNEYNRIQLENPGNRFRVKICLTSLPDVCSNPITNNDVPDSPETILSTKLIGTVAAGCTVLVIVLAVLLFLILIRTRRLLPGLADLKDMKRIRKSSKDNFHSHISKPVPLMCPSNSHGMIIDTGDYPLLNTYSCEPIHLPGAPMDIFNVCSSHSIFNEGLYSTLIKSNSINHFPNDASSVPLFTDSTFMDKSLCYCHNDQPMFPIPPPLEETTKPNKIFYEVMV